MNPVWIARAATAVILLVAVVTDVRERRAPLWLTGGGTAAALLLAAFLGREALTASATGAATGAGLLLPMLLFGWVGAGDALLLAAIGAWDGWRFALWTLCLGSVAGGLLGVLAWRLHKKTIPYVPALAAGALASLFFV